MQNDATNILWAPGVYHRDGVALRYIRAGSGEPLLLLHGVTDNAAYWGWTGRQLALRFDVIALDQRGHGLSDAPAEGYRIADYVADAAGLLLALASEPARVVGHSFGGWVATRLAAQHPGLVRDLVLEDPPFRNPEPLDRAREQEDADRYAWFASLREFQTLDDAQLLARCRTEHPTWSDEDCSLWATSKRQVRPRVWQSGGIEFDLRWQDAAPRVACPTLLLYGDAALGSIVDADAAARVTAMMPRCRAVHIPGAGHAIHREQPAAMLAAMLQQLLNPATSPRSSPAASPRGSSEQRGP